MLSVLSRMLIGNQRATVTLNAICHAEHGLERDRGWRPPACAPGLQIVTLPSAYPMAVRRSARGASCARKLIRARHCPGTPPNGGTRRCDHQDLRLDRAGVGYHSNALSSAACHFFVLRPRRDAPRARTERAHARLAARTAGNVATTPTLKPKATRAPPSRPQMFART
jgi:hypothetical protein